MLLKALKLRDRAGPTRLAAALTILIGLLSLTGWIFNIRPLTSFIPGAAEMKINTCICLICCGAALLIISGRASAALQRCAQGLSLMAVVVGLLTLVEYSAGWNLRIDELLMADPAHAYNVFRGRMSPFSAATFVALGLALAAMPHRGLKTVTSLGALLGLATSALSLLGYLWNAGELVTDAWLPPVAVHTAVCFLLISAGILLSPRGTDVRLTERIAALPAVEARTLAGFVFAFLLLVIGGGYTYRSSVQFADSVEWVSQAQEVRATLATVYGSLAGAELAERDYLLTADRARLAEYRRIIAEIGSELTNLGRLTSDNAVQRENLNALRSMASARIEFISSSLDVFSTSGLVAARAFIARNGDTNSTRNVRTLVDRMDSVEVGYLNGRQARATQIRHSTLISLVVTLVVAFAAFIGLFGGIHKEMRARRGAEKDLVDANRFLDSLIENLPVMIVLKDAPTLSFVRHNRAFEKLLGFTREELQGKSAHNLFSPEEADFIVAKDREALESGGLVEILEQTIHTRHSGSRVFHTMKMPLNGEDGKPQFLLAISVDITQRKLAELAVHELNAALRTQAEQLQATNKELESFSYSISHDLRAPLRAIDGFAMMLEEDYAPKLDAEGARYLSVIRENSQRMGNLIDDLLAFSRLGRLPVVTREVNVETLVREVIGQILQGLEMAAPKIEIGPLPPVQADPALLRQVWTNLISNAVKYSSKSASPCIELSGQQDEGENRYSVRDNGVGFNMEYADKLFGVFQRLHRADEFSGTGVGLAIVHRVVTRHGGRVWAEGSVDRGAVFSFALPA